MWKSPYIQVFLKNNHSMQTFDYVFSSVIVIVIIELVVFKNDRNHLWSKLCSERKVGEEWSGYVKVITYSECSWKKGKHTTEKDNLFCQRVHKTKSIKVITHVHCTNPYTSTNFGFFSWMKQKHQDCKRWTFF